MAPRISLGDNQYIAPIPAHRFQQGGRDVYYFTLDIATLDGLLPQRIDDNVIKQANRRLTPNHARNIQVYLENRPDDWLLGAMLLGIAPDALHFEPYENDDGELIGDNFGQLLINSRRINTMRIFDGQHRRRAIQDALAGLENDAQRSDEQTALKQTSIPIVLYAEEDMQALRQMFSDASKTKRIEANVVVQFDQRNAFHLMAKRIADESRLFSGRIEMNRTTIAASSQCLIAINQLADTLRTLAIGYDGRNTRARNSDYMLDIEDLFTRCLAWSDDFMPKARSEYAGLASSETTNDLIPHQRAVSLAYSATFMRILAGCYHNWCAENPDWESLAAFLRDANLEPGSGRGALLVDAGVVLPGERSPIGRRQEVAGAIRYIVRQAKAHGG